MTDSGQTSPVECPRCNAPVAGHLWCQKCGLNLRPSSANTQRATPPSPERQLSTPAGPPTPPAAGHRMLGGGTAVPAVQLPRPPIRRAWERATRTIDSRALTAAAVAVAVAAVVVAIVFATKGGGSPPAGVANASTIATAPAPAESTPTEATAPTVESSQVESLLTEYRQAYSDENLEVLKGLFAESLQRHDGSSAPEDLSAALATYERQFSELRHPRYSLSEINVEPGTGEASARAQYSISSQNGTVTGTINYHLVEQEGRLLIDRLGIEPSQ